jgi:hypothetical protein
MSSFDTNQGPGIRAFPPSTLGLIGAATVTAQKAPLHQIWVVLLDRPYACDSRSPAAIGSEKWITLALFVGMLASGISGEWLAHRQQHVEAVRPTEKQARLQSRPGPQHTLGPVHLASQLRGPIQPPHF